MHVRSATSSRSLIIPLSKTGWTQDVRRQRDKVDEGQREFHVPPGRPADAALDRQPIVVFDRERYKGDLEDMPRAVEVIPYTGPKRPDNTMVYYPARNSAVDASGHLFRDDDGPPTLDSHRVPCRDGRLVLDEAIIVPANARRPGLAYSYPKRLRWVTST